MQFKDETPASQELWADYGKDFYATTTFADLPAGDGRKSGWVDQQLAVCKRRTNRSVARRTIHPPGHAWSETLPWIAIHDQDPFLFFRSFHRKFEQVGHSHCPVLSPAGPKN